MQRDDYKNALNELQLSSKFCEKMEKKLSDVENAPAEEEYEDVVTHVDVIKHRSYRGLAAAAAFVIAAGAAGGGMYYKYSSRNASTSEETPLIYEDYNIKLPFDVVTLHDNVFNVNDRAISTTVVGYEKTAKKLYNYLKGVEWTELEAITRPVIIHQGISFDGNNSFINIKQDDTAVVTDYSENEYYAEGILYTKYKVYQLTEGTYAGILSILLEDFQDTNVDFCGVKANAINAAFHSEGADGVVSQIQAYSLAYTLNSNTKWKEDPDAEEPSADEQHIDFEFVSNKDTYYVDLYGNGTAYIRKNDEAETKYSYSLSTFDSVKSILKEEVSWSTSCPIDFEKENAVIIQNKDGEEKAYLVEFEDFNKLASMVEDFSWREEGYFIDSLSSGYPDMHELKDSALFGDDDAKNYIQICIGDSSAIFSDNQKVTHSYFPTIYSIDEKDLASLKQFVENDLDNTLNDDELADYFIDKIFNATNIYDFDSKIAKKEMRPIICEKLKECEWTKHSDINLRESDKYISLFTSGGDIKIEEDKITISYGTDDFVFKTDKDYYSEITDIIEGNNAS